MNASRFSLRRLVMSITGGMAITFALLAAMLITDAWIGPNTAAYRLFGEWLIGWPEQLLSPVLLGHDDGGRALTLFLWNVLLYAISTNIILQLRASRRRLP